MKQLSELLARDVEIAAAVTAAGWVEGTVDLLWWVESQLGRKLRRLVAVPVWKDLMVPMLPFSIFFWIPVPAQVLARLGIR